MRLTLIELICLFCFVLFSCVCVNNAMEIGGCLAQGVSESTINVCVCVCVNATDFD